MKPVPYIIVAVVIILVCFFAWSAIAKETIVKIERIHAEQCDQHYTGALEMALLSISEEERAAPNWIGIVKSRYEEAKSGKQLEPAIKPTTKD